MPKTQTSPAFAPVVARLDEYRSIWIDPPGDATNGTRFDAAIKRDNLCSNGELISSTQFKRVLEWLVAKGYVTRIRREVTRVSSTEIRYRALGRDEFAEPYTPIAVEYVPTERFPLLCATKKESGRSAYFATS